MFVRCHVERVSSSKNLAQFHVTGGHNVNLDTGKLETDAIFEVVVEVVGDMVIVDLKRPIPNSGWLSDA